MFGRRPKTDAGPKPPKPPDKMVIKVRTFRAISAWDRMKLVPGFAGLKVQLRRWDHSDALFHRLENIGEPDAKRSWTDPKALAIALRAASALYSDSAAFPTLDTDVYIPHEPEGRWARAPLGQLLDSLSLALQSLPGGFVALLDDGRGLIVRSVDGGFESDLYGEWPEEIRNAFS